MNQKRYEELEFVEEHLKKYKIEIQDENGYKPFNEVLMDISKLFRQMMNVLNEKELEQFKKEVLQPIVGVRYINGLL